MTLGEFTGPAKPDRTGSPRLLFVGRVCPDKGVHVLIDAFEKVLERFPNAELKVVGSVATNLKATAVNLSREQAVQDLAKWYKRPYVTQLKERMSPRATQQIEITGEVSRAALIDQYRRADVFVLPSIYAEGFGIPIVEAGALAVPTVASRRGGVPEVVVDGQTGLLVAPGDANALADAILKLLENEPLRQAMGKAAYARAASCFTWERVANSLLAEYYRLLGDRPQPNKLATGRNPTAQDLEGRASIQETGNAA